MLTDASAAVLAVGTNAAVQNIHALPNRAQTMRPGHCPSTWLRSRSVECGWFQSSLLQLSPYIQVSSNGRNLSRFPTYHLLRSLIILVR
jgi:hypothetical protein